MRKRNRIPRTLYKHRLITGYFTALVTRRGIVFHTYSIEIFVTSIQYTFVIMIFLTNTYEVITKESVSIEIKSVKKLKGHIYTSHTKSEQYVFPECLLLNYDERRLLQF